MRKHTKLSLILCSIANLAIFSPFISSCREKSDSDNIYFSATQYKFVTSKKQIFINLFCSNKNLKRANVKLINIFTNRIRIFDPIVSFENGHGKVIIELNDVPDNTSFVFGLSISYSNKETSQYYELNNFLIQYNKEPEIETDMVSLNSNINEQENYHYFNYSITFFKEPKDTNIHLELTNQSSLSEQIQLELIEKEVQVVKRGDFWNADFDVKMPLKIIQNVASPFNIELTFTNSLGNEQHQTFYDCIAKFVKTESDTMPYDYYDISLGIDNKYTVNGIKSNEINPTELGHYRILDLPSGINKIADEAFANSEYFDSIHSIIIPRSVTRIGNKAFYGVNNIYELNLLDYETNIPEWCDPSEGDTYFDKDNIKFPTGTVWCDNLENISFEDMTQKIQKWGLTSWLYAPKYLCTDESFFEISDDGVLKNIKEDKKDLLPNIKIIKIPQGIKLIEKNALDLLKSTPYTKIDENNIKHYYTRRLVLNNDLNNLNPSVFEHCGVSGPIIINSKYLEDISSMCFAFCNVYSDETIITEEDEEPLLFISDTDNLTTISNFAFAGFGVNSLDKTCSFTQGLTSIGDFAFSDHNFEKLIFSKNINSVGQYAFSNAYHQPIRQTLNYIDLSCYNEIINPLDPEFYQTYIPDWLEQQDFFAYNSCKPGGTIKISQHIKDEIEKKKKKKLSDWVDAFKTNHGIPSDWVFDWV